MICASVCVWTRPQVDRREGGIAVEALVVCVVRVEEPLVAGLVNELLARPFGTECEGQRVAGTALRRVAVAQVVDTQAAIQAFDLQDGGVVSEPQLGVSGRGGYLLQIWVADRTQILPRLVVLEDEGVAAADVKDRLA